MALIAQNCQMEEVAQIIEIDIKEEKMDGIQNEFTESDVEIQTVIYLPRQTPDSRIIQCNLKC